MICPAGTQHTSHTHRNMYMYINWINIWIFPVKILLVNFAGEHFREFRGSISERENIIHEYNY